MSQGRPRLTVDVPVGEDSLATACGRGVVIGREFWFPVLICLVAITDAFVVNQGDGVARLPLCSAPVTDGHQVLFLVGSRR